VVVDVANSPSFEDSAAMSFFQTAGKNLVAAEIAAKVRHHVALSIVGSDRLQDSGYLRAKVAQEAIVKTSPIPYTIVRATQFFEFLRGIAQSAANGDTIRLSHALFQPMAADDVAAAVVDAALGNPANGTIEIAGPDTFHLDEIVGTVLAYDHDARKVIADPEARYFGARLTDGSLVPAGTPHLGATRFEWWLTHTPAPAPRPKAP
jgi:uncharacterized protein YbjT (DUF2867 family)